MEDLLESRVKQLCEIDDQLSKLKLQTHNMTLAQVNQAIQKIRIELADMIRVAQAESAAF